MKLEENIPLASLTTFKVGGPARYLITLESKEDAPHAVRFAQEKKMPLVPFGGGSNILPRDETMDVVLVRVGMSELTFHGETVHADAGVLWDHLVTEAVRRGLWGIENLSAIPGTVGGAVIQNVGAYGQALSETFVSADVYDTHTGAFLTLAHDACAFEYRSTLFKKARDRYLVLSARFKLNARGAPCLAYKDVKDFFQNTSPRIQDVREAVIHIRAKKFPPLDEYGTAGSFFLNPVVSKDDARALQSRFPQMPVFDLPEGGIKIPLGWFFEHVLKIKGYTEHGVESWRSQALVIATHPGATATDVRMFTKKIVARARDELSLVVEPEVREL